MGRTLPEPTDRPGRPTRTTARHGLTDEAWARLEAALPPPAPTGRPAHDARRVVEGLLWLLATGAPWRDLPSRFGPWQTVYGRFRRWAAAGVLERLLRSLQRAAASSGLLDLELWCVDTTVVRASRVAGGAPARRAGVPREDADHALGRSRGGFGTKLALVCDRRGTPLSAVAAPGQQHDVRTFPAAMKGALRAGRPARVAGDKAYSVAWVRTWLRRRQIRPVIPTRRDQLRDPGFDAVAYRGRNAIERLVGWLKESRRVATRFEKLAVHYLGFVRLAMVRRLLRALEPSRDLP